MDKPVERPLEMNPTMRQLYLDKTAAPKSDAKPLEEAMPTEETMPQYNVADAHNIVGICAKALEDYHMNMQSLANAKAAQEKSTFEKTVNTVKIVVAKPSDRTTLADNFVSKTSDNYQVIQKMVAEFNAFQKTLYDKNLRGELQEDEACDFSKEESETRAHILSYLNSTIVAFKRQNHLLEDSFLRFMEKPDSISSELWKQMIQFEGIHRFIKGL